MAATASVTVATWFAPFDDTQAEFLRFVGDAQHSIRTVIYGYHLPTLTDLLIAKHRAGLVVELILDHSQAEGRAERSEVQKLIDADVPLLIGTSPVHRQILHSKFTVVDELAVEFGSWNYSLSASAQSNTMSEIRHDEYAQTFLQHFDRLRAFIQLHEMAMQAPGEAELAPALPGDADPPPISMPISAPSPPAVVAVTGAQSPKRGGPHAARTAGAARTRAPQRRAS